MMQVLAGALIGAGVGFFIGKHMSKFGLGCPLICNPKISTIYFALMGVLFTIGK